MFEEAYNKLMNELKYSGVVYYSNSIYIISDIRLKRSIKLNSIVEHSNKLMLKFGEADKILFCYNYKSLDLLFDYNSIHENFKFNYNLSDIDIINLSKKSFTDYTKREVNKCYIGIFLKIDNLNEQIIRCYHSNDIL